MPLFKDVTLDTCENVKLVESAKNMNTQLSLTLAMDNNNMKYSPEANRAESMVGDVEFFIRTYAGNKVVVDRDNNFILKQELKNIPKGISLSDYILVCARDLLFKMYKSDTEEDRAKLAMNSFPIPYSLYFDKKKDMGVALMQVCVNSVELVGMLDTRYHYESVDNTELISYLEECTTDVKFKRTQQ